MVASRIAVALSAGALLGLSNVVSATASELKVYPLRLALTPKAPVTAMTLHNAGAEPVVLQLQVFSWRQRNGEDVLEPTREVLANPAIFELAPRVDQIARFGLQTDLDSQERSYRVIIQEVPRGLPLKPGEVITLLRLSVPIFVPPIKAETRVSWRVGLVRNGKVAVQILNTGSSHIQFTKLSLARMDGQLAADHGLSTYVLAGASSQVVLDARLPLQPGEPLEIRAATDQGAITATTTSHAD